jgi:hypothetical protein
MSNIKRALPIFHTGKMNKRRSDLYEKTMAAITGSCMLRSFELF